MGMVEDINKHMNKILNLVIVVIALWVSYNIYDRNQKAINKLSEQKETQIKKNKILEEISLFDQKIREIKDSVNKNDVSLGLKTIAKLAKGSSVKIVSIRPLQKADYPLYSKYPFDMEIIVDNYNALGVFVSALENDPASYSVESLELRPKYFVEQKTQVRKLAAHMSVYTILFN